MPTFGAWEATVLEHTYDEVDFISLHSYYEELDGDRDSFLASAVDMDRFIDAVVATADAVAARRRSPRRLKLSFDEWNVWYQHRFVGERNLSVEHAPRLIEDTYSVTDAVVVGSLLITLLRHADRVGVACQAQLVNVIAPIRSEPGGASWRQTVFYPFAQAAAYGRGTVLRTPTRAPRVETKRYGDVELIESVTLLDEETGALTVFAVNRDKHEAMTLLAALRGLPEYRVIEHVALSDDDPDAVNDAARPDRVTPRQIAGSVVEDDVLRAQLPALSWNVLRLEPVSTS
jgi:alpha-N-arabinofuranosidase